MVILMKSIKPKRLDDKAMVRELYKEMGRTAKDIKKDFEGTTATWKKKPKFVSVMTVKPKGPEVLVDTDNEIYRYVNDGTKPREIWAGAYTGGGKQSPVLVFPSAFTPKTSAGSLKSGGGSSGGPLVFTPVVGRVKKHSIKARNFDAIIQKKWDPRFKKRMQGAMTKARKVSKNPI